MVYTRDPFPLPFLLENELLPISSFLFPPFHIPPIPRAMNVITVTTDALRAPFPRASDRANIRIATDQMNIKRYGVWTRGLYGWHMGTFSSSCEK